MDTSEASRAQAIACPPWCVHHEIAVDTAAMRATHFHQSAVVEVPCAWGGSGEVQLQQAVPFEGEVGPPWVLIGDEVITAAEIRASMALLDQAERPSSRQGRRQGRRQGGLLRSRKRD